MKILYLCIFTMFLFSSACVEEKLPPVTQKGNGYFGCLVNGEVWIPRRWINSKVYSIGPHYESFNLVAYRKRSNQNIDQTIAINIGTDLTKKTRFILSDYSIVGAGFSDMKTKCFYDTSPTQTGTLEITKLDTINHIIAGTFEFTVWTEECDTIRVTEGRFDIKYGQ